MRVTLISLEAPAYGRTETSTARNFRARGERGAAAVDAACAQVHILIASVSNPGGGLTSGNELQCDPPLDIGLGARRKANHKLGRAVIVPI